MDIIYQDDDFLAVAKRSGQFVHATDLDRSAGTPLVQEVRNQIGRFVFPVHRIDRATSGIVLLALNSEFAAMLSQLFIQRMVQKQYVALVRGFCDSGIIDRPLSRKEIKHDTREPQPAVTEYSCLQKFTIPIQSDRFPTTRCSLVEARPRTGRFHQIRRHLSGINCPVIGDTSHGDSRQNRFFREQFSVSRLMLAATRIQFAHPITAQAIDIQCAADHSFQAAIDRLADYRLRQADVLP